MLRYQVLDSSWKRWDVISHFCSKQRWSNRYVCFPGPLHFDLLSFEIYCEGRIQKLISLKFCMWRSHRNLLVLLNHLPNRYTLSEVLCVPVTLDFQRIILNLVQILLWTACDMIFQDSGVPALPYQDQWRNLKNVIPDLVISSFMIYESLKVAATFHMWLH